jgi:dolichyl-diphosphooligosaccharide--protein glycosyltransferase
MVAITRRFWIAVYLVTCMAIAFFLRSIPAFYIGDSGSLQIYDTDTWFTLRQIELMVAQFPAYAWFDPMTAYPFGKVIAWGPFLPFVAAAACIMTGAATQAQIIFISGWISPIAATLMVLVMYYLGKTIWDTRAGLVAAGLITVLSFRFFFLSTYGYADHHILEVVLSTLFMAAWAGFIAYTKNASINLRSGATLKIPGIIAFLAGVLLFGALITSTTILLVIPVIAVSTFVIMVLDYRAGRDSVPMLFLNAVTFSVAALLIILFGVDWNSISFTGYTLGLVIIIITLPVATILLWILAHAFQGKPLRYGVSILLLAIAGSMLILFHPLFRSIGIIAQQLLLGSSAFSTVVQETQPWTIQTAWANFNLAIVMMMFGLIIVGYYAVKKQEPLHLFFLIWSLFMLFVTVQYRRFEYYSTMNIVLLTAICITEPFRWVKEDLRSMVRSFTSGRRFFETADGSHDTSGRQTGSKTAASKKKSRDRKGQNDSRIMQNYALCLLVIFMSIVMVSISATQDFDYANSAPSRQISSDWIESLDWIKENTPSPGIEYYRVYDKKTFSYPEESYGIMASWEAGHWITFFAHRIPITNPFQDNLAGKTGAAAFFLTGNESAANAILESYGGHYVITDADTAVETFSSLVPWPDNSVDVTPYIKWLLAPSDANPSVLVTKNEYDDAYFQSMVVRLHNYDGSLTEPDTVNYIQYTIRNVPAAGESSDFSGTAPVITYEQSMNASLAKDEVQAFHKKNLAGEGAIALTEMPDQPVTTVPALQHYRLIHESPDDATVARFTGSAPVTLSGIKTVKIFEYVAGGHIAGDGVIEVTLQTNTGRTFTYRQASVNGTFIVPYSTKGSSSGIVATGPYHIVGTERDISVTEDDVIHGRWVNPDAS